jgi:hypothetical protein
MHRLSSNPLPSPRMQRGKDGHLTLNSSDDFFSNPLGGGGRSGSLGERAWAC